MRDDLTKAENNWRKRRLFKRRRGMRPLTWYLLLLLMLLGFVYYLLWNQQMTLLDVLDVSYEWLVRSIRL